MMEKILELFKRILILISAVNIFLFSIIASFIYEHIGINGASIFHCVWNYTQICIFSIPVSGVIGGDMGVFKLINSKLSLGFGLEGSFITTIVQIIVVVLVLLIERRIKSGKGMCAMRN